MPQAIDYAAIAKKFGGTSEPAPAPDYAAIAKQFGGTSEPQPDVTVKLDYEGRTKEQVLADQAAKFPTAAEAGRSIDPTAGQILRGAVNDLAQRGATFAQEEGPAIAGAVAGGAVGSLAGPAGTIAGAAGGAGLARAAQQTTRIYSDDPNTPAVPRTIAESARDIGGAAVGGALQEAGGPIASKYGEVLARAAARGAPEVLGPATTAATRLLKTRALLTPEERAAVDLGHQAGIPMSAGMRTGSSLAKGAESAVTHLPGSAGFIDTQKAAAEQGFSALGDRITAGIGPEADRLDIGTKIRSAIGDTVRGAQTAEDQARNTAIEEARNLMGPQKSSVQLMADLKTSKEAMAQIGKDTADEAYSAFRKIANSPENAIEVHTGTTAGNVLNASGNVIRKAVTESIASPVDLTEAKAALRPLLDNLEKQSSTALREASPGYQAFKAFMGLPDQISADQAISELSAIQNISRNEFPAMRNTAQGVTAKVIPLFRQALDRTAEDLGPEAKAALDAGRAATKARYDTFGSAIARGTAKRAETRPIASLISDLNVTNVDSLLQQTGGAEMPAIRRAITENMIRKSSKDGVLNAEQLARNWNGLGAEVKTKLFTPEQSAAMDHATSLQMLYGPEHPAVSLMNLMETEPAKLVDTLTASADKSAETLRKINITAPDQMPALGRATVESIIDKASTTGHFMGDSAFANWNKLGLETKRLLLGGDMKKLQDVDSFFQLGKMLKQTANPSGTGKVNALTGYVAGSMASITALAMRPGLDTAAAAAMTIAGVPLSAGAIARLLYSDGGAKLLTEGIKVPATSSFAPGIARRILGRLPDLASPEPARQPVAAH